MMDSQEKALEVGMTEEVNNVEASAEESRDASQVEIPAGLDDAQDETAADIERPVYTSKKDILARVKEIAHGEDVPEKGEVDYLKTTFYKLHIAEREAKLKAYIDGGGDAEAYQITPDEDEEEFKAEMGVIRERRAKAFKEQEEEKEANLQKKLDIIEKIKSMVTSPEEANKSYKEIGRAHV